MKILPHEVRSIFLAAQGWIRKGDHRGYRFLAIGEP